MWLYLFAATVGTILIVPTVLQAIDRRNSRPESHDDERPSHRRPDAGVLEFAAFAATTFGVTGLVVMQFEPGRLTTLIASLSLGMASGALHPEILGALSRPISRSESSTVD